MAWLLCHIQCAVDVYVCAAECSIYFNVYIMHIKNNAMPSILIKIKENLFTETNDLLAKMKDGSVAEKEKQKCVSLQYQN